MSVSLPFWTKQVLATLTPSFLGDSWALPGEQTGDVLTTHSFSAGLAIPILRNADKTLGVAQECMT